MIRTFFMSFFISIIQPSFIFSLSVCLSLCLSIHLISPFLNSLFLVNIYVFLSCISLFDVNFCLCLSQPVAFFFHIPSCCPCPYIFNAFVFLSVLFFTCHLSLYHRKYSNVTHRDPVLGFIFIFFQRLSFPIAFLLPMVQRRKLTKERIIRSYAFFALFTRNFIT